MSEITKEQLAELQKAHITFLETQLDRFQVSKVPVIKCFNYKLIQIINNIGLKAILEAGDNGQNTDQP